MIISCRRESDLCIRAIIIHPEVSPDREPSSQGVRIDPRFLCQGGDRVQPSLQDPLSQNGFAGGDRPRFKNPFPQQGPEVIKPLIVKQGIAEFLVKRAKDCRRPVAR